MMPIENSYNHRPLSPMVVRTILDQKERERDITCENRTGGREYTSNVLPSRGVTHKREAIKRRRCVQEIREIHAYTHKRKTVLCE